MPFSVLSDCSPVECLCSCPWSYSHGILVVSVFPLLFLHEEDRFLPRLPISDFFLNALNTRVNVVMSCQKAIHILREATFLVHVPCCSRQSSDLGSLSLLIFPFSTSLYLLQPRRHHHHYQHQKPLNLLILSLLNLLNLLILSLI